MLVLQRKCGEKVIIDGNIIVTVLEVDGQYVRLGVDAPLDVQIMRPDAVEKRPKEDRSPQ